jgi:hypothetical protein
LATRWRTSMDASRFRFLSKLNIVWFQRFVYRSNRTFERRSKRLKIGCVKCIEWARFSHNFVRMTLVCRNWIENRGIFQSHHDGS